MFSCASCEKHIYKVFQYKVGKEAESTTKPPEQRNIEMRKKIIAELGAKSAAEAIEIARNSKRVDKQKDGREMLIGYLSGGSLLGIGKEFGIPPALTRYVIKRATYEIVEEIKAREARPDDDSILSRLSPRAVNGLKWAGMRSDEQVATYLSGRPGSPFQGMDGIGPVTRREILEAYEGMVSTPNPPAPPSGRAGIVGALGAADGRDAIRIVNGSRYLVRIPRQRRALTLYLEGKTLKGVGEAHGVSQEQARVMISKAARMVIGEMRAPEAGVHTTLGLSVRAQNCLRNALRPEGGPLPTDEAVRGWVQENGARTLLELPNMGRKTYAEICDAFGFDPTERARPAWTAENSTPAPDTPPLTGLMRLSGERSETEADPEPF